MSRPQKNPKRLELIEALHQEIGGIHYRGVSVFALFKIAYYTRIRKHRREKNERLFTTLFKLSKWLKRYVWCPLYNRLSSIVVGAIPRKGNHPDDPSMASSHLIGQKKFLFVCDHNQKHLIEMINAVIGEFDPSSVTVLTNNADIYRQFVLRYPTDCTDALNTRLPAINRRHLKTLLLFALRCRGLRYRGFHFTKWCIASLFRSLQHVDFYFSYLQADLHQAVLSISDVHPHACAVVNVARQKDIPTYSLQHGAIGVWHTPLQADTIFVWGQDARSVLLKFGVPSDKIQIAGKPKYWKSVETIKSHRAVVRRKLLADIDPFPVGRPVVTYIVDDLGGWEDRILFECFLTVCDLDVIPVVKFRPANPKQNKQQYLDWIAAKGFQDKIRLWSDEPIYEVLAVTDILIAFGSTAAIEALSFSVICIILDIFKQGELASHLYELDDLSMALPHYSDCLIVRGEKELRMLISSLIGDWNFYTKQARHTRGSAPRFFHKPDHGYSEERFIADFIQNRAAH